jgi:hypothetical protein
MTSKRSINPSRRLLAPQGAGSSFFVLRFRFPGSRRDSHDGEASHAAPMTSSGRAWPVAATEERLLRHQQWVHSLWKACWQPRVAGKSTAISQDNPWLFYSSQPISPADAPAPIATQPG